MLKSQKTLCKKSSGEEFFIDTTITTTDGQIWQYLGNGDNNIAYSNQAKTHVLKIATNGFSKEISDPKRQVRLFNALSQNTDLQEAYLFTYNDTTVSIFPYIESINREPCIEEIIHESLAIQEATERVILDPFTRGNFLRTHNSIECVDHEFALLLSVKNLDRSMTSLQTWSSYCGTFKQLKNLLNQMLFIYSAKLNATENDFVASEGNAEIIYSLPVFEDIEQNNYSTGNMASLFQASTITEAEIDVFEKKFRPQ